MAYKCDFEGYATKNDLKCTDGRVIRRNAFKANDGDKVPLMWQHQHDEPSNVIGHAYLENRNDGVYCYCSFNNNPNAVTAKEAVQHGDIDSLSIYANQLKHQGCDVVHGCIKEVSLVIAGANPGACIVNSSIAHSDGSYIEDDTEATIFTGLNFTSHLEHADDKDDKKDDKNDDGDETIADIIDTMNEKQKAAMNYIVGEALASAEKQAEAKHSDAGYSEEIKHSDEGGTDMKTNVFDNNTKANDVHADELRHGILSILSKDNKSRNSITSLRDTLEAYMDDYADTLQHDDEPAEVTYGFRDIDYLFPDAKVQGEPEIIKRDTDWVSDFMTNTKHSPISRIKCLYADITADEARAKGYIKGNQKTDEVISLLKRTTEPTTVYKKNKLDRDDILDITDFDVIRWLKGEMRIMLDEEIARAALVSDGRDIVTSPNDKIDETKIRPIWTDADLYTVKVRIEIPESATDEERAALIIKGIKKAKKLYKGSGNPTFYTTEDDLTDMLLIEDGIGREKYETEADVAKAIRAKKIVTVPVMDGLTRTVELADHTTETRTLVGILVNPTDYRFGADKGGNIATFEDFDLNINQQIELMETRLSGSLVKPYSALAIETVTVEDADEEPAG